MISGDRHVLEEGSSAHARLMLQKAQVDRLDVFVWPQVHSAWQIWRAARTTHYDVVTAQDPFWRGLLAWKIARLKGAKLNLQVHADLDAQPLLRHLLAALLLRHAGSVRAVSERLRKQILAKAPKAHVEVLPIFVDLEHVRAAVPVPKPFVKTILWIGRFEKEKDPLHALEVLKEVRASGVDVGLVMLGAGSLEAALRRAAQGLPVKFPGWQKPGPYLKSADLVLVTSPAESYGASIIEALGVGTPVVAPDIGIAREAGAKIAPRTALAGAVLQALMHARAELKIPLLSQTEWAAYWKETL